MENNMNRMMDAGTIAEAQQKFLTKVYGWMVGGLLLTALTSLYVYQSGIWYSIATNSVLFILLIIGELAMVFTLASRVMRMQKNTAILLFLAYSVLNGLTLSVVFAAYTASQIQDVFFIAASMFLALSVFGYVTKKDLSGVGRFMFMGLIGLIVASVINIFIGFEALNFAISVIGVLVFAGLTAYDTQKLKHSFEVQFQGDEIATKAAINGALMLYLDFINLFLFLLSIFGGGRK